MDFGQVEPLCPHCGATLENFPSRKILCKSCRGQILKRTRPDDRKPILIRPDQAEQLEALWAEHREGMEAIRFYANQHPTEFRPILRAITSGIVPLSQVNQFDMFALAMWLAHDQQHAPQKLLVPTCPWCWSAIDAPGAPPAEPFAPAREPPPSPAPPASWATRLKRLLGI